MDALVKLNPWMPSSGNTIICTPCKSETSNYCVLSGNGKHHFIHSFFLSFFWQPSSLCRVPGTRGEKMAAELSLGILVLGKRPHLPNSEGSKTKSSRNNHYLYLGACPGRKDWREQGLAKEIGVWSFCWCNGRRANCSGLEYWAHY